MRDDFLILNPETDQAGIVRRKVRIIMIGTAEDVEQEIIRSHLLNHSHVHDWSGPLHTSNNQEILTRNPHKVMRIWKRYMTR